MPGYKVTMKVSLQIAQLSDTHEVGSVSTTLGPKTFNRRRQMLVVFDRHETRPPHSPVKRAHQQPSQWRILSRPLIIQLGIHAVRSNSCCEDSPGRSCIRSHTQRLKVSCRILIASERANLNRKRDEQHPPAT